MNYIGSNQKRQYVAGIYMIESACGKKYIGSAVSLRGRFMVHRQMLRDNDHDNSRLQNFYNKHGVESLSFRVIEVCDREMLLIREQWYIDTLNPFFNIARTAGATYGLKPWLNKRHSEETKLRIKNTNLATFALRPKKPKPVKLTLAENIERFKNLNKSLEAREALRQRKLGNTNWLGKKHKPETIENRKGELNGRARSIFCVELNHLFKTGIEAAVFFGVGRPAICASIKRGTKMKSKYTLSYGS